MPDIEYIQEWSVAIILTILVIVATALNNTVKKLRYSSLDVYANVLNFTLLMLCIAFWIKVIIRFM